MILKRRTWFAWMCLCLSDWLLGVVLLGKLHVAQVLGVASLVANPQLGVGLPRGVAVVLAALRVIQISSLFSLV